MRRQLQALGYALYERMPFDASGTMQFRSFRDYSLATASDVGLNGPIGPHRRWGWARTTLADVKRVRGALGGTVRKLTIEDAEALLRLPGVQAVITGRDIPNKFGILPISEDEESLAVEKVRYVGDPVAAVAAIDEETAEAALKHILVEYEVLQPVMSIEAGVNAIRAPHDDTNCGAETHRERKRNDYTPKRDA